MGLALGKARRGVGNEDSTGFQQDAHSYGSADFDRKDSLGQVQHWQWLPSSMSQYLLTHRTMSGV